MIVLDLVQNIALLVALAMAYRVFANRYRRTQSFAGRLSLRLQQGLLFGLTGLVGMMTPVEISPGIVFDGRSVILGVAGLYGGPLPALLAAVLCAVYRFSMGGAGAWVGIAVVFESAALGAALHHLRQRGLRLNALRFWLFGLLIHFIMLALMLTLPNDIGWTVLRKIGPTVILLHPLATMLVCLLFQDYESQETQQDRLKASLQRLGLATSSANLAIWDWDIANDEMMWDERMYQLYGLTERSADFDVWSGMLHPQDRDEVLSTVQMALAGEREYDTQFRICRPDGDVRYVQANGLVIRDAVGRPVRMIGINQDVTERKRAQAELQSAKAILQTAMDQSQAGIAVADAPSGQLRYVNNAGLLIPGGSREELIRDVDVNRYVADWKLFDLDGKPLPADQVPLARAVLYGETSSREFVIRRAEGDDRYVWANAAPVVDDEGRTTAGVVVFLDITERKQAEKALRESEERYRYALEATRDGLWDLDLASGRVKCSPRCFEMLGYKPGEVEPTVEAWTGLLHPQEAESVLAGMREQIRREGAFSSEFRLRRQDGEYMWIMGRGRTVEWNEDGSPKRIIGTHVDIHEQKQMQERLRQMEKMDAIGQLAGGIAHDFNNQLTGVMGYAGIIRSRLEDPTLQRHADNILLGARRAADLTKKLLAFARKGHYESVPVDLHAILYEVTDILSHSVDKRIVIKQILTARPSTTRGDPGQLQNALLNLALNAADAMPEGGELIFETSTVELSPEYCRNLPYEIDPGWFLRVCVTDSGCGIPREHLDRVFEPFFTTKATGHGTGMGLAAVYGTVKHHRGAINVYSEVGHGTTFRLYLPLEREAQSQVESRSEAVSAARPATILVVDDEQIIRHLAQDMLADLGYDVLVSEDGLAALDVFRERWREIDLVILDMVMPRMNGLETYRAMKSVHPDVRVLLASGYSVNGAAQGLLDEGVQGFIQKPFEQAELSHKVAAVLQARPPIQGA